MKAVPPAIMTRFKTVVDQVLRHSMVRRAERLRVSAHSGPCLIFAPHPDDETLGCGELIVQLRAKGRRVVVIVAANGGGCQLARFRDRDEVVMLRRQESTVACQMLGVAEHDLDFLGFDDGELLGRSTELADRLAGIIDTVGPASVVCPYRGDEHPDHRGLANAVQELVSSGRLSAPVFEYPVWLSTRQAMRIASSPRSRAMLRSIPLEPGAERKRAAIAQYHSQMPVWQGVPIGGALSKEFIELFVTHDEIYLSKADTI